ncbi:MAG: amidohydrolase family protein [Bryobacteraceae bacterium]|nr:amidohydrolase family protein [Bryobacteraceae bacterium]
MPRFPLFPLLFAASCAAADPPLALRNVTVVDPARGAVKEGQTVLIRGGRIAATGTEVRVPRGAREIDAGGKFLIPGLWDAHVHLVLGTEIAFPALLANGVTSVRDMGGDLTRVDEWRRRIRAGEIDGPTIYRAGPYVDGPKDAPDRLVIRTAAEARAAVRSLQKRGVDFIKIHNAVPREAYFALAEEARRAGIRFAGHVPLDMTPEEAASAGQASLEHMATLVENALAAATRRNESPVAALERLDDAAAVRLFRGMAANRVAMTPNLTAEYAITNRGSAELESDPRRQYVPASLVRYWSEAFQRKPTAARQLLLRRFYQLVALMQREGVTILAGTDLGLRDIFPGFSIHDELRLLVQAGLTPAEALRSATVAPAAWMGVRGVSGDIRKGVAADLVLLHGNPLQDISQTARIHAVVARGRLLDREKLDAMLAVTAKQAGSR